MRGPAYMSACARCAEKMGKIRIMSEVSQEFIGTCPGCRKKTVLKQYAVGMTHAEYERQRRRARAAEATSGGGERARATHRRNR